VSRIREQEETLNWPDAQVEQVGVEVGRPVGEFVGVEVGRTVREFVGVEVGLFVGEFVGDSVESTHE